MNNKLPILLSIPLNTVHIWQIQLSEFLEQKDTLKKLLNSSELARANRFKFAIHHNRFTIARAMLRKILSLYIGMTSEEIEFGYEARGKPYLNKNTHNIQFNLSHSDDWAVYAITKEAKVGIDIEKMQNDYKESVAKRFFSEQENNELLQLPFPKQVQAFYRIWVKKEAVIKLLGGDLYSVSSAFTVGWSKQREVISIQNSEIQLYSNQIAPYFPIAIATQPGINNIKNWQWKKSGYHAITK